MTEHPGVSAAGPAGRFAPSPSGDLHVGNLRTAVLAWLFAHTTGRRFLLRMENLDRTAVGSDARQIADLHALGLSWEEPVLYQTDRLPRYRQIIDDLAATGRTFECFCTRREILEAPSAPHTPPGAYPGTCRTLTAAQREAKRAAGRPPAIRIIADRSTFTVDDVLHGHYTGAVDDFVIQRGDGTPAYNLAVVVDDAEQGIDQVCRGDDLLSSAPRQAYLATLLGYSPPTYAHVPMVLNPDGVRLSKRDGAVTLADLAATGVDAGIVLDHIAVSLGLAAAGEHVDIATLAARFDPAVLPRTPWIVSDLEWR
ncbi:tRNA glutamyl-Q(34) synthetase GluQRS [Gordonia polyisoprenivorans]|uniref:tRNA glutamyl-Q(34) synthetase GluQRS n=1 Tax=Gordonia polyisoprenivorans TaxID=84595 RepID=UPI000B99DFE7|nr:tRNA glutamyl-Q(34) synthetase GluQRS [Gordonia polyisoprenivorans]OZC32746.1 tRNA glutamyl-Q(34) synthetase GluQRS [Gordonia polyisoprenivorans]QUD82996.1 tRNA glutamyl-Q(34) synthetase GluQRS [Gordonia polyisoprenivorans]